MASAVAVHTNERETLHSSKSSLMVYIEIQRQPPRPGQRSKKHEFSLMKMAAALRTTSDRLVLSRRISLIMQGTIPAERVEQER